MLAVISTVAPVLRRYEPFHHAGQPLATSTVITVDARGMHWVRHGGQTMPRFFTLPRRGPLPVRVGLCLSGEQRSDGLGAQPVVAHGVSVVQAVGRTWARRKAHDS